MTNLRLPRPDALPSTRSALVAAVRAACLPWPPGEVFAAFGDPAARAAFRERLAEASQPRTSEQPGGRFSSSLRPPGHQAEAGQREHDRYFAVERAEGDAGRDFVAGLLVAHLSAYENCLSMGVTLLDEVEWRFAFGGLAALLRMAGGEGGAPPPARPRPAGWRDGYDPGQRWLIGHQLFFALIQGAISGLNCFADAASRETGEAGEGLALAAAFMHSSAAAMKLASDFSPADYDRTIRPDMAPPRVRDGFSGLQTRDHDHLVRLFGALKPVFATCGGRAAAHGEFVDSVVAAYAAHEFICARFRGDVLPSLRMAAASHGRTSRTGVEVLRELMQARLSLASPSLTGGVR